MIRYRIFLRAEWRDLAILNYQVDPAPLQSYVPPGTELDSFDRKTYVSLVGLRFCQTKMFGSLAIPFHTDFDEVNLRFYVRRRVNDKFRRGVVFIKEIVPRQAVAQIARIIYGENYVSLPMQHTISFRGEAITAEYQWRHAGRWCRVYARSSSQPAPAPEGSIAQFITEHYWGYSKQRKGGYFEYQVEHVPWNVWHSNEAGFAGDAALIYGPHFAELLQRPPDSAFIADGSPVIVFSGAKIAAEASRTIAPPTASR